MSTLELEAENVDVVEVSTEAARAYFNDPGGELPEVNDAIDAAQGRVFSGAQRDAWVVIHITQGGGQ